MKTSAVVIAEVDELESPSSQKTSWRALVAAGCCRAQGTALRYAEKAKNTETISDAGVALTVQGPSVLKEYTQKQVRQSGDAGVPEVTDAEFGASEDRQLEMKA